MKKIFKYLFNNNFFLNKSLIIERMEVDFIFSRLLNKKKLRILDVGAHHGEFLDIFSNLKFGNIKQKFQVFCFEPFLDNFNIIKKKLKKISKNVKPHIYNFAISNKTQKKLFYVGSSDTLITCETRWLKKFKKDFSNYKKKLMECLTFNDFIEKYKFDVQSEIDLLKIDVEGHDLVVLRNILENNIKINSIMIEFDANNLTIMKNIISYLKIKKFAKIFIFGRSGIYTSYIGQYETNNALLKIIKKNRIQGGNIVAFKKNI
jgi:FkbM family methyltransferase